MTILRKGTTTRTITHIGTPTAITPIPMTMVSRWMGTPPSGSGLLNMWIGAHLKILTIAMTGTKFATMNKN